MRQTLRRLAVTALLAPVAAIGATSLIASPAQAAEAKPGPSQNGSWLVEVSQPGSAEFGYPGFDSSDFRSAERGQWTSGSWSSNPWKSGSSRHGGPSQHGGSWNGSSQNGGSWKWTPGTPAPETTQTAPVKNAPATTAKPTEKTLQDEVNRLINVQRANNGCAALTVNDQLTAAARAHSAWMAQTGTFSHTGSGGSSFVTRAKAAGYAQPSAENIAMGYRTAAEVVDGWMNSPGHRTNIVNCQSKTVGVGVTFAADGSPYYTQDFGY